MFRIFDKISGWAGKLLVWISALALAGMMAIIVVNVLLRKVFDFGIPGAYDLVSMFLSFTILFAMVYTQQQKGHVHVTFIVMFFKGKARYFVWALGLALAAIMSGIFTYSCWNMWDLMMMVGTKFSTVPVPYWIFHMAATVCFALLTLVLVFDTIKAFAAIANKECAADVDQSFVS